MGARGKRGEGEAAESIGSALAHRGPAHLSHGWAAAAQGGAWAGRGAGRGGGGGGGGGRGWRPLGADFLRDKAHRTEMLSLSSGKGRPGFCPAGKAAPALLEQVSSLPLPCPPLPRDFIFNLVKMQKNKAELQRVEIY